MAFSNRYKDTLNKLIDSSDLESSNWARSIDNKFYNAQILENNLANFSKRDFLNKNLPNKSSQLAHKI